MELQLNPQQTAALNAIKSFLQSNDPIFILKGSAGTGKTTLVQALCKHLKEKGITFRLTATTGRAAKVLSSKSGQEACTLHSLLYVFDEITGRDDTGADPWESKTGQLFLSFGLRTNPVPDDHPKVIIVDEASMISHLTAEDGHTARFGSGNLLADLQRFAGGSKLIFVGDACQLPPVAKESMSAALSQPYWGQQGKAAHQFELTDIVRQKQDNEILHIATLYRQRILNPPANKKELMAFPLPQGRNVTATLGKDEFLSHYIALCRRQQLTQSVAICHSNTEAGHLNNYIRQQLHGQHDLQPGELLMVVQNSYSVDLVNGDQVVVEAVSQDRQQAGFTFLNLKVRSLFSNTVYETKAIRELLYNQSPGLQPDETKYLLIDFDQRMRHLGLGRNSAEYKNKMRKDPYLNALRAKFGYAITVHKAQGGEWNHVFLYLNRSVYAPVYASGDGHDTFHRWFYTAITRAREKLVVNDCPLVEKFARRQPQANAAWWKQIQKEKKGPALSPRKNGVIKKLLNHNGQGVNGFIKPDDAQPDVYFSVQAKNPLFQHIKTGIPVSFELLPATATKKAKAIHLKLV